MREDRATAQPERRRKCSGEGKEGEEDTGNDKVSHGEMVHLSRSTVLVSAVPPAAQQPP